MNLQVLFCVELMLASVTCRPPQRAGSEYQNVWDNDHYHPKHYGDWINPPYTGPTFDWSQDAKEQIALSEEHTAKISELSKQAKNVIFMMGDGMGISTITAGRVYMAQQRNLTGNDAVLSWENLPNLALSRTYSAYEITADSAATATAMVCGEKAANSIICANQDVREANCDSWEGNALPSVLHEAMEDGKWTGIVSTARVTHASPACTYASSPHRNWECDTDIADDDDKVGDADACSDIAYQLIMEEKNKDIRVILGGGREKFFMFNESDVEYPDVFGERTNLNLVEIWESEKENQGANYKYVTNQEEFDDVNIEDIEYLLGLFEPSHMQFDLDRTDEPSLAEMVSTSIDILQRNADGYFLFVEGGRIDHAHHDTNAKRALEETVALSDAVQVALDKTDESDTLIIVTADHSHVFTIAGYPSRDTNILATSTIADDNKDFAILSYGNGPGFYDHRTEEGFPPPDYIYTGEQPRLNLTGLDDIMISNDWRQDAPIPLSSETHGGEDVGIFARGPMAHLFRGTQEQSYIAHLMRYAMCVGSYKEEGNCPAAPVSMSAKGPSMRPVPFMVLAIWLCHCFCKWVI